jgi:stage III sporulation protein AA
MIMMIRSMSPKVIITDEIGRPEDAAAVEDALNAGIKVIVSAHGSGLADARSRPFLTGILEKGIFERVLILGNSQGVGTLEQVYGGREYRQLMPPAKG